MPDATPSVPPVPGPVAVPPPPTDRPGRFPSRVAARLLAPVRYARRHPVRALAGAVVLLVLLAGAAAGGTYLWFHNHLSAARTAVDRGHNAVAIQHLVACRKVHSTHPEVLLLMSRVARRSGRWDDSEQMLDEYWSNHGDDEALVFERLLHRAARGELESAGPPLLARIRAGGADAGPAREALVTGYLTRFLWPDADRALTDWLSAEPDNTTALLLRGKLQEQRLDYTGPPDVYRRIVELDPDHDEARLRLTTVLLQRYSGEEALPHLERLRERLPNNHEVLYQWAAALGLQGRTAEARAALDELLRINPSHPAALAERGKYAALDRDDAAAADYLGKAVRLDPGNLAVRHQHIQALTRAGQTAEAARAEAAMARMKDDLEQINQLVRTSLQSTPNDPNVHHRIAVISLRSGQPDDGLRWLQSALQVDPDHLPTHQTLAGYYQATGNPVLAARHRAMASRLGGKGP